MGHMAETLVVAIHIILCIFIIIVILLQSGKGSDMGAAFGGSSQTVFGSTGGATFLTKITTWVAIGFLVTSLLLAYNTSRKRTSGVVKKVEKVEKAAKPAANASDGEKQETKTSADKAQTKDKTSSKPKSE